MGLEGVYMDKVSIREYQPRLANIYIYTRVARKIVCVAQVLTPALYPVQMLTTRLLIDSLK